MTITPYYQDERVTVHAGDCLDVLATLPDASVDAVVTDPPYALGFMGKEWDTYGMDVGRGAQARKQRASEVTATGQGHSTSAGPYLASGVDSLRAAGMPFQLWCQAWATECLRVLKPGGHLLAFGGTRTSHRLACAIEDAGFEIRDSIAWLYGSGFPKSLDVGKAIDKAAGARREVVGTVPPSVGGGRSTARSADGWDRPWMDDPDARDRTRQITAPATDDARTWQGWGTALKPAHEPIVVARKPLVGTVAANVLTHGTGALNVDGCRIEHAEVLQTSTVPNDMRGGQYGSFHRPGEPSGLRRYTERGGTNFAATPGPRGGAPAGRWPANVILDESQAAALDEQTGVLTSGANPTRRGSDKFRDAYGDFKGQTECAPARGTDQGGASRFFYVAKADSAERPRVNGIAHPTVKPLALMRWLVRLVTPPGGTVLEPFAGSGTTVEACLLEGLKCIAIERETDYLPLIVSRLAQGVLDFTEAL